MYLVKIINDGVETVINAVSNNNKAPRITGTIKKGINTIDSFTFNILPNNQGYTQIDALKTLIEVINTKNNKTEFKGRILLPKHSMSETGLLAKTVVCESELGYLMDSTQRYGEYHNVSVRKFLEIIIDNHNKQVSKDKQFTVGIVDVRDNNGGYLSSVTDIASYLLPRGKKIYQIQKNDDREVTKDKTLAKREYPIAILVNGNSASASEILAGVIKESYGGFVVGTKTYGKGTVQQVKKLSDGSMIKYTVENWLTPDGNWIDGVGIEPTDYVELSEEYINNPIEDNDNQLKKALELVSK